MALKASDLAAFARLGIGPELLAEAHVQRVSDQQARTELNRAIIRNLGELVGFQAPITSMCWNNRFAIYSDPICQDSFSPYLRWLVCPFRCRLKILPEASRYAS